jgi:hypothetical protein
MTEQTLDRVARALATGMPRRRVTKSLLAGGAAGTVALFGAQRSRAARSDICGWYCATVACDNGPSKKECVQRCRNTASACV